MSPIELSWTAKNTQRNHGNDNLLFSSSSKGALFLLQYISIHLNAKLLFNQTRNILDMLNLISFDEVNGKCGS